MVTYEPGETLVHRLDPRSKLLMQAGLAIAAFTHPSLWWIFGLTVLAVGGLAVARYSPLDALWSYRIVIVVLALGPVIAGIRLGPPWFRIGPALDSVRSVTRLLPVLLVSAGYMYTTPVRDTRAAIQRSIPGRPGQLLAVGVALTVRFVPILRADVATIRSAIRARGGETRSLSDRASRIAGLSLHRAWSRSDALSTALRARCFAYNPTLPPLRFGPIDYLVIGLGLALAVSPLVGL